MGRRRKPTSLDAVKRREILAILTVGGSRRMAARYVGCSPRTIGRTAVRDPAFAEELRKAEHKADIGYLKNIQAAARKEQYWRAAAWALERRNPQEFAARHPDVVTLEQLRGVIVDFAVIVVEEIPVAKYRQPALARLRLLWGGLGGKGRCPIPPTDGAPDAKPAGNADAETADDPDDAEADGNDA